MVHPAPATPKRSAGRPRPGLIILMAGCAALMAGCATTAPPSVTADAPPAPLSAAPVPRVGPRPPTPRQPPPPAVAALPPPRASAPVKSASADKPALPTQAPTARTPAARAPQSPATVRPATPATPAVASPPTPPTSVRPPASMPLSPPVPKAVGIRLLWPVHGKAADVTLGNSREVVALAIAAAPGSPVAAAAAGKVVFVGPVRGKGDVVVIRHSATLMTIYGHLQPIAVMPGTSLRAGDRIGTIAPGETAAHLHFELRDTGRALNPRDYF